jgi:hypothetical protein
MRWRDTSTTGICFNSVFIAAASQQASAVAAGHPHTIGMRFAKAVARKKLRVDVRAN